MDPGSTERPATALPAPTTASDLERSYPEARISDPGLERVRAPVRALGKAVGPTRSW